MVNAIREYARATPVRKKERKKKSDEKIIENHTRQLFLIVFIQLTRLCMFWFGSSFKQYQGSQTSNKWLPSKIVFKVSTEKKTKKSLKGKTHCLILNKRPVST